MIRHVAKWIDFGDLAVAVTIAGTVPGDIVIAGGIHVIEAFNGTTPVIDVGFGVGDNQGGVADPNALASALAPTAVGNTAFDELTATTNKRCTVADTITATYSVASGTPTTGKGIVWAKILNTNVLNDNRP